MGEVGSACCAFEGAGAATKLDWVRVEREVELEFLPLKRRRVRFLVGVVVFLAKDLLMRVFCGDWGRSV